MADGMMKQGRVFIMFLFSCRCRTLNRLLFLSRLCFPSFSRYSTLPNGALGSPRRVVITGLGLITPLGIGAEFVWQKLIDGKCGVTKINAEGYDGIPAQIAAFVPRGKNTGELDEEQWFKTVDKRSTSTESLFALVAASEAFKNCGWVPITQEEKEKVGVSIGTGISGLVDIPETSKTLKTQGYRKVSPFFVPRILLNMPAGLISIRFGLQGPNHSVSTACAAGAHAIGDAYRMIVQGDAEVMLAGGTEACISPLSMAGFCKARALTTKFNKNPQEASRPFDKDRSGFVIGEGAGVVVLEERNHAVRRGANIHAEVLGYGFSGDAYHITAPGGDGHGALLAMKSALRNASLSTSEITYINAHATSTPLGDAIENKAIRTLFADHKKQLKVSSTKGATGHLLGAAGAVEAVFTVFAASEGLAPPTLNLQGFDSEDEFDLNYVALLPQQLTSSGRIIALTNSFGFGGTNCCLCIAQEVGS